MLGFLSNDFNQAGSDDQIDAWLANEPFPWPFTEKAVREGSEDEQTLRPPS